VQYKFSRPSLSLRPTLRRPDYQFDGIIDFGHEIDTGALALVKIPNNASFEFSQCLRMDLEWFSGH